MSATYPPEVTPCRSPHGLMPDSRTARLRGPGRRPCDLTSTDEAIRPDLRKYPIHGVSLVSTGMPVETGEAGQFRQRRAEYSQLDFWAPTLGGLRQCTAGGPPSSASADGAACPDSLMAIIRPKRGEHRHPPRASPSRARTMCARARPLPGYFFGWLFWRRSSRMRSCSANSRRFSSTSDSRFGWVARSFCLASRRAAVAACARFSQSG